MNTTITYFYLISLCVIGVISVYSLFISINHNRKVKMNIERIESRLFDLIEYMIETTDKQYLFEELELCGISKYEYDHLGEQYPERMNDMYHILDIYLTCRCDDDKLNPIYMPEFIKQIHNYYNGVE